MRSVTCRHGYQELPRPFLTLPAATQSTVPRSYAGHGAQHFIPECAPRGHVQLVTSKPLAPHPTNQYVTSPRHKSARAYHNITKQQHHKSPQYPSLLGTRTLLVAPGHTIRNKKLLGAKGITRSTQHDLTTHQITVCRPVLPQAKRKFLS